MLGECAKYVVADVVDLYVYWQRQRVMGPLAQEVHVGELDAGAVLGEFVPGEFVLRWQFVRPRLKPTDQFGINDTDRIFNFLTPHECYFPLGRICLYNERF